MEKTTTSIERRNEILQAAEKLFYEKGYDSTSITDILKIVGIAKGTLYYYFTSKEEIMNAIIDKTIKEVLVKANKVADDNSLTFIEKLKGVILSCRLEGNNGHIIMEHIHKPQNALMHQVQLQRIIKDITPVLTKIICEGIDKDIFHTEYPYESVEMILIYSNIAFDDLNDLSAEEISKKVSGFINNCTVLFGADKGTFDFIYNII